jgi:hypothetical protein
MSLGCDIKFDNNPYGIFFAGQTVSGTIELTLGKPKKVRGISVKISGHAKVQWSETTGTGKKQQTTHYSAREDYITSLVYLVGSDASDQIDILPGIHTFNFSCFLPQMLPSSFEGKYGHIRYTITVTLERPWKFDQSYKMGFTVIKHLDLNYDSPALRIPTKYDLVKTFGCWCCTSKPLFITVQVPISGFVPGQIIPVSVHLVNESHVEIEAVKIKLVKVVDYKATYPRSGLRTEKSTLQERRTDGVGKHSKGQFEENILIPAVPPSTAFLCRIISVRYEVEVTVKTGGMHLDPVLSSPFTIGTIPLLNIFNPQYTAPTASAPIDQYTSASAPNSLSNEVPMSFVDTPELTGESDIRKLLALK